jgi:hypothetical protein
MPRTVQMLFWLEVSFLLLFCYMETGKGIMTYQAVQESRLLLALDAAEETDDGDDAVEGDGLEGLGLQR